MYGFNGQERETELSNAHTSAEFWMYDGRIGRRWNVDPVVKVFASSYASFSNNPIIMVDPNGDDDYFNLNGQFIGSDNNGRQIKIVLTTGIPKIKSQNLNSYLSLISILPSQLMLGKYNSKIQNQKYYSKTLYNIAKYYRPDLSFNSNDEVEYSTDIAHTDVYSGEISLIGGYEYENNTYSARSEYNNIDDFNSLLDHEGYHSQNQRGKLSSPSVELEAYYYQINSNNFKNTTTDFKNLIYQNVNSYITEYPKSDRNSLVNKFFNIVNKNKTNNSKSYKHDAYKMYDKKHKYKNPNKK